MKKIISLVLAMIMIFAIGATAFALNVGSVPEHEHDWSDWVVYTWGRMRVCDECGIVEFEYFDGYGPGDEKNPETGASAALGVVALVSAAAVASFKRK